MGNEIVMRKGNFEITSIDDLNKVAEILFKSGYFTDAVSMAQAAVKIMAGQEMGFGPYASMTGIHIIQGKPEAGADMMAKGIKRSGRYDYKVSELTDKVCSITYYELTADGKRSELGTSTFTLEDAKRAGTKNLDKFPRNMLFARAMSNGIRWYCPDVFETTVYAQGEIGDSTINAEWSEVPEEPAEMVKILSADAVPTEQKLTLADLLDRYGPEAILNANGGAMPKPDEVEAVAEKLAKEIL